MAETAKLMNPAKKVFLPDMEAGCSLASSITGEDVRLLKQKISRCSSCIVRKYFCRCKS